MTTENLLYLAVSVSLSAGRNLTSKRTAVSFRSPADFLLSQAFLFGTAALLLLGYVLLQPVTVSAITWVYGLIYGILLILSQWMFTLALKRGNTSVCSVVYSLGFILPTVFGSLFWQESFSLRYGIGVILAVLLILLSGKKESATAQPGKTYFPFILIAMVSSGGLGIMQKVQGTSGAAEEKGMFLLIAFGLAFGVSFFAWLLCWKKDKAPVCLSPAPVLTGLCFGGANLFNTILAGRMNSAVFFPLQNISTILLTCLLGILLFKEKITRRTVSILLLGAAIIMLFSL